MTQVACSNSRRNICVSADRALSITQSGDVRIAGFGDGDAGKADLTARSA